MSLEREFQYFKDHQTELVEKYRGRFIVIMGEKVVGDFDDEDTAISETMKTHELGTFLVQKCEPGPEAYTQTFHSRVASL